MVEREVEDEREVENAPPAIAPAGMKNASAYLAKREITAAPITTVDFMVSNCLLYPRLTVLVSC